MAWPPGAHASTFGGNPVACAAANVTIKLLKEQLIANAAAVGDHLIQGIRALQDKHPIIGDVRGRGLMIGIELKEKVAPYIKQLQENRIIALNAGMTVIRLLPPLVISYQQIDHLVDVLKEVLAAELVRAEV